MTASKKQLARWADLKNRKEREDTGFFLAEGRKLVDEAIAAGWHIEALLAPEGSLEAEQENGYGLTDDQRSRVSGFRTVPEILAVVRRPLSLERPRWIPGTLALVLDGLQDPGNVGSLIRTAAWFGWSAVFHTADSADPFGPKAVQASMGALFRVKTSMVTESWFDELPLGTPILGTFLEGEPIFGASLPEAGLLVMGNEGHGIRDQLERRVTRRLTIPRRGTGIESLNVAAAAAILMAEFRRGSV